MNALWEIWWRTEYGRDERYFAIATEKEIEQLRRELVAKYGVVYILPYNPGYALRTPQQIREEHSLVQH